MFREDYDDGFVAFLNGVEIDRSTALESAGEIVPFDAFAGAKSWGSAIRRKSTRERVLSAYDISNYFE